MTRIRIACTGVALLGTLALPPVARANVSIHWNTCAVAVSSPIQSFACGTNTGTAFDLIVSESVFPTLPDVVGADARLWFDSQQATLPSWWQIQPGGCRESSVSFGMAAPFPSNCGDLWGGAATVSASIEARPCAPSTLVIDLHASLPVGVSRPMLEGTRYAVFRMRMLRDRTTGTDACSGCSVSGCIGLSAFFVTGLSRSFSDSGAEVAGWQSLAGCDSGPNCGPTPARASTWGTIKSLYR